MMDISVFTQADREPFVELWQRCNFVVPWINPYRDIDRKMAHSPDTFWVGRIEGMFMASIMFGYDGHRGSVNYLAIDPAYQSQGHGAQLMAEVESKLRLWGCPKINLAVRSTNKACRLSTESLDIPWIL